MRNLFFTQITVVRKAKTLKTIRNALRKLNAGGSTAGGEGIQRAYQVALENFVAGGNNRVILATDDDFNVGVTSTSEMVRLIEEKRKAGIFLTICGFGMGNYKDGRMEQISNAGNSNYFYIDNIQEAKIELPVANDKVEFARASENFRFSAAVAGFGMLLRDSQFKGDLDFEQVITLAENAAGSDENGYRTEFISLVKSCALLDG